MLSNYRIHESKLKAMRGNPFSFSHLSTQQHKMQQKLHEYGMIESMCTNNHLNLNLILLTVNDGNEEEDDEQDNTYQINSILHLALEPKTTAFPAPGKQGAKRAGLSVALRVANVSQTELSLSIDSLEIR